MFRRLAILAVLLACVPYGAHAEISPPPLVPTLQSVEWTVGPGVFGSDAETRAALPLGIAIPVARVASETELYVGFESGFIPVWSPFSAGIPLLAKAYLRFRLSDATGIRLGLSSGVFLAVGNINSQTSFLALGHLAFDVGLTKTTRLIFEPAAGLSHRSGASGFVYYPRISLGLSL